MELIFYTGPLPSTIVVLYLILTPRNWKWINLILVTSIFQNQDCDVMKIWHESCLKFLPFTFKMTSGYRFLSQFSLLTVSFLSKSIFHLFITFQISHYFFEKWWCHLPKKEIVLPLIQALLERKYTCIL